MPIYEFKCENCRKKAEIFRKLKDYHKELPECCGAPMGRVFSFAVVGDITPYRSVIDGSLISSRSEHRQHLKQHNCIEVGNEYKNPPKIHDTHAEDKSLKADIGEALYEVRQKYGTSKKKARKTDKGSTICLKMMK